jgi:hypothetical protein
VIGAEQVDRGAILQRRLVRGLPALSGVRIQDVGLAGVVIQRVELVRPELLAATPVQNLARWQQMRVDGDVLQRERLRPSPHLRRIRRHRRRGREIPGRRIADRQPVRQLRGVAAGSSDAITRSV